MYTIESVHNDYADDCEPRGTRMTWLDFEFNSRRVGLEVRVVWGNRLVNEPTLSLFFLNSDRIFQSGISKTQRSEVTKGGN